MAINLTTVPTRSVPVRSQAKAAPPAPAAAPVKPAADVALVVGGTHMPTVSKEAIATLSNTFAPERVNVEYPASMALPFLGGLPGGASVAAGAEKLVAMAKDATAAGKKVVLWGFSQGAVVVNAAARLLAADPNGPARDQVTLVRAADPSTPGMGIFNALPAALTGSQQLTPEMIKAPDTPYDAIVIVNQYDGFADFPSKPNPLAALNAMVGTLYQHGPSQTVDLSKVPAKNVTMTVNALGATTTTYLVPAKNVPLTQPLRDLGIPAAWVDGLDGFLRPAIEAGYDRPGTTPARAAATRPAARPGRSAQTKRAA